MAATSLGTLLIQRLDAALGTTLSQQTNIVNRARPDAVTQPGQTERPEPPSGSLVRHPRETADRAASQMRLEGRALGTAIDRPLAGRGAIPAQITPSAPTTLGTAARIIVHLLANHAPGTTAITGSTPLIPSPPGNAGTAAASAAGITPQWSPTGAGGSTGLAQTAQSAHATQMGQAAPSGQAMPAAVSAMAQQVAQALSQAIQHSGLFYESHLKALAAGQYKLTDIQREPQGQLRSAADTAHQPGSGASTQSGAGLSGGTTATSTATAGGGSAAAAGTTTGAAASHAAAPAADPATPGVDSTTHGLVRQQLEALADHAIQWRGDAWPGAAMEWRIERQSHPGDDSDDADTDRDWESRLDLHLPGLGAIEADVRLSGKHVHFALRASEASAALLEQHSDQLGAQLNIRQLELSALSITPSSSDDQEQ